MTNKRQYITNVKEIADAIKHAYPDADVDILEDDSEANNIRNKG